MHASADSQLGRWSNLLAGGAAVVPQMTRAGPAECARAVRGAFWCDRRQTSSLRELGGISTSLCRQTLGGWVSLASWCLFSFFFSSLNFGCFVLRVCVFFFLGARLAQGSVTQGSGLAWVRRSDPARLGGEKGSAGGGSRVVCLV